MLVHGRGADEHDLQPLADALDPDRRLVAMLPRGPLELPPGGAHWYVVRQVGRPDAATFLPTYAALGAWVDAAAEAHGLSADRVVLAGFSQGAVMSYAVGLGAGRPRPAGIIALSGFVPEVDGWEPDLAGRAGLPVAIGHGTLDPVIDVDFGRRARALLEGGGLDVRYQETRMAHSIDPAFVDELRGWLRGVVPDR